jgi:hypothetical protein
VTKVNLSNKEVEINNTTTIQEKKVDKGKKSDKKNCTDASTSFIKRKHSRHL